MVNLIRESFTMSFALFMCLTIIFHAVNAEEGTTSVLKEPELDDKCSGTGKNKENKNLDATSCVQPGTLEMLEDLKYEKFSENPSEKENLVVNEFTEHFENKSFYPAGDEDGSQEPAADQEVQTIPNLLNTTSNNTETEIFTTAAEIVTEVNSVLTSKETEVSFTVKQTPVTETTVKLITQSTPSTTELRSSSSEFSLFQNLRDGNNICLCDLTVNQCDINCCCDKDCTLAHWKVFTTCIDKNIENESHFCFKNNFVFKNNTKHKIVQNEGGLFCIVTNNSQVALNYKTRPIIRTLDSFTKSLPKHFYSFSYKNLKQFHFKNNNYQAGFNVWALQNGEIKPFGIPAAEIGVLCSSQLNIKYLINQVSLCSHQLLKNEIECGNSKVRNVFHYLKDVKIISRPNLINATNVSDLAKICQTKTCIKIMLYNCKFYEKISDCIKIPEDARNFPQNACWNTIPKIQYRIFHNGSEGIMKFEAYVWLRNLSIDLEEQLLQRTEVKYIWVGPSKKVFERSGNPGYLTGKPLLAGQKIYYVINGTTKKKEAIEMSVDSKDWLNVLGSEKGKCSSMRRIPINFRENGQYMCSLELMKNDFGKDKCLELQNHIFKLLIGNDLTQAANENFFNKFVATFGNSKVEDTEDWVQVLIDLFPVISSQVFFKSNYNNLVCKNMITDLYVDIAYSKIGSFLNPQSKILGVSFQFGKHKDLIFYCGTSGCENTTRVQLFKLSTMVHFIDLTEPAVDAFAEPLGLEAKLPHDFFYPFFSKSPISQSLSIYVFSILLFIAFL